MALKRGPTCEKPKENQTLDGAHVKEPQTRPSGTYKKMKRRGRFPTGSRKILSLGIIQDLWFTKVFNLFSHSRLAHCLNSAMPRNQSAQNAKRWRDQERQSYPEQHRLRPQNENQYQR
ncbi:hypothetical protein CISG_10348 [Coccidioides immitis RMSCC 3703]|uniref:Uncharacterized protein n=1 Tax=Coccidioides immitis RMSCC 3703 TaxID=454286 RepID=A0A0J8QSV5_COCIT|nr:hypothetical protein CISG_10348 [Coccidioides immitis RMSCC 3703]